MNTYLYQAYRHVFRKKGCYFCNRYNEHTFSFIYFCNINYSLNLAKHMIKRTFLKTLTLTLVGLICSVSCIGCNNKNPQTKNNMQAKDNGKVLIVYFSHAGDNYGVGNIKIGNTKLVADEIQRITGGDEFEIVAEKNYDMPYDDLTVLAKKEAERGEKPAFKGELKNLDQYSTIFIGGPIWWGTYPRVMFTFFDKYDLNHKTIIPFSTHEGSGLGSIVSDLKSLYPNATFKKAFDIYGHETRQDLSKVDKWLKGLGY